MAQEGSSHQSGRADDEGFPLGHAHALRWIGDRVVERSPGRCNVRPPLHGASRITCFAASLPEQSSAERRMGAHSSGESSRSPSRLDARVLCERRGSGSGSAVWYLTCFSAKLDLMLPTPGMRERKSTMKRSSACTS